MATTFLFEFDWANTGAWTDESAHVLQAHIRSGFPAGAAPFDTLADVGSCVLTLNNETRRYSPDNADGPLAGDMLPRRPMRVQATDGVTTWTLWCGYIDTIRPDVGTYGPRRVVISGVDMFGVLQGMRVSLGLQQGKRADQLIAGAVNAALNAPAARATITLTGNPADGNTVTINGQVYTFKNALASAYHVKIGATAAITAANLKAAINTDAGVNTLYGSGTARLPGIAASAATNVVTVKATLPGTIGNSYMLAKIGANLTISGSTFSGGADWPAGLINYRTGNEAYDIAADQWTGGQTPVTAILADCARSEQGRCFVQRDGTLTFYDRRWFFRPLVSALTLNASPFEASIRRDMAHLYNLIRVTIHPRATTGASDVLARIVAPIKLPPVSAAGPGMRTITLPYRDTLGNPVGATDVATPLEPYTDYTVKRDPNVSGNDYTVSPLFAFGGIDVRGSEIVIPLYNYETFPLYVTKLQVRGKAVTTYDPLALTQEDAASQAAYLTRVLALDLPLAGSELFGDALALYLLDRYKGAFTDLERVTVRHTPIIGGVNVFAINLFDVLTVTDAQSGITNLQAYVTGIDLTIHAVDFELTWHTTRADDRGYWNLGTVGYGELGTYTRLAV
ncbi:MAG: hypothetical protein IT324_08885 [Anaerolineae bacterium]|nr:hypothetical protein [Anaerolineae bacterium]